MSKTDDKLATLVDDIRDNAYTNLTVAVEATNLAISLSTWFNEEITEDTTTVSIGDMLHVKCSYNNPRDANPTPEISLKVVGGDEYDEVIESNMDTNGEILISNFITKADILKQFVCESKQIFLDEEIYSSSIVSTPLNVIQPPTITVEELPDYYTINGADEDVSIVIPVKFSSIPQPQDSDVIWRIEKDNNVDINDTESVIENSALIVYPNTTHSFILAYPIEILGEDLYLATIEIFNITSNLTLVLEISNEHGDLVLPLPEIIFYPKEEEAEILPYPPSAKQGTVSLGIVVSVIFILIILIALLGAIACYTRNRGRKMNEETNAEVMKKVKKYQNNKESYQIDLDNVPEDKLQTLEHRLLPNAGNHPMIHRSESDETRKNKDEIDAVNGYVSLSKSPKKKSPKIRIKERKQKTEINTEKRTDIIIDYADTNDDTESVLFNEELLNVHTNQPQVYAGLQDLEPEVMLRSSSVFKDDGDKDENDTMIRTPDGTILRLSGPTNYPVMSPPPANFTFERTPSRKTSQLHFMAPSEF